jgi:hypothetical protein
MNNDRQVGNSSFASERNIVLSECKATLTRRDSKAKVGREDIFKPTIENESLHEISNDNGVTAVNFAHIKICQTYNVPTS